MFQKPSAAMMSALQYFVLRHEIILKDALALPTEARAALAGSLLDSLDGEVDEDAEAAWAVPWPLASS